MKASPPPPSMSLAQFKPETAENHRKLIIFLVATRIASPTVQSRYYTYITDRDNTTITRLFFTYSLQIFLFCSMISNFFLLHCPRRGKLECKTNQLSPSCSHIFRHHNLPCVHNSVMYSLYDDWALIYD
ncbi:hypothetical protein B0H12DRAFT_311463 [Mycena haematopus]|nr:hypothetical protein B0H12DRAFT_311463 [Mycena haematopus]